MAEAGRRREERKKPLDQQQQLKQQPNLKPPAVTEKLRLSLSPARSERAPESDQRLGARCGLNTIAALYDGGGSGRSNSSGTR